MKDNFFHHSCSKIKKTEAVEQITHSLTTQKSMIDININTLYLTPHLSKARHTYPAPKQKSQAPVSIIINSDLIFTKAIDHDLKQQASLVLSSRTSYEVPWLKSDVCCVVQTSISISARAIIGVRLILKLKLELELQAIRAEHAVMS